MPRCKNPHCRKFTIKHRQYCLGHALAADRRLTGVPDPDEAAEAAAEERRMQEFHAAAQRRRDLERIKADFEANPDSITVAITRIVADYSAGVAPRESDLKAMVALAAACRDERRAGLARHLNIGGLEEVRLAAEARNEAMRMFDKPD